MRCWTLAAVRPPSTPGFIRIDESATRARKWLLLFEECVEPIGAISEVGVRALDLFSLWCGGLGGGGNKLSWVLWCGAGSGLNLALVELAESEVADTLHVEGRERLAAGRITNRDPSLRLFCVSVFEERCEVAQLS